MGIDKINEKVTFETGNTLPTDKGFETLEKQKGKNQLIFETDNFNEDEGLVLERNPNLLAEKGQRKTKTKVNPKPAPKPAPKVTPKPVPKKGKNIPAPPAKVKQPEKQKETPKTTKPKVIRGKIEEKNYTIPQIAKDYWKNESEETNALIADLKKSEGIYNQLYIADKRVHIGIGHIIPITRLPKCLKGVKDEKTLAKVLNNPLNHAAIRACINKEFDTARSLINDEKMKEIGNITEGHQITNEQIELLLAGDMKHTESRVKQVIKEDSYNFYNSTQKKVLLDIFYNVRFEVLKQTKFVEAVNNKDIDTAQKEMNFFNGSQELGIIKRRYKNMQEWKTPLTDGAKKEVLSAVNKYITIQNTRNKTNKPEFATFEEAAEFLDSQK